MFKKLKSNPKYGVVILLMLFLGIALPDFGQFQVSSLADKLRAAMDLSQSQYSTIATAPLLGQAKSDPLALRQSDYFTVTANLACLPALSLPFGRDAAGLPIGVQLIGRPFAEAALLGLAALGKGKAAFSGFRVQWTGM